MGSDGGIGVLGYILMDMGLVVNVNILRRVVLDIQADVVWHRASLNWVVCHSLIGSVVLPCRLFLDEAV